MSETKPIREVVVVTEKADPLNEFEGRGLESIWEIEAEQIDMHECIWEIARNYFGDYPALFYSEILPDELSLVMTPYAMRYRRGRFWLAEEVPWFVWRDGKFTSWPRSSVLQRDASIALEALAEKHPEIEYVHDAYMSMVFGAEC